jgi:uncharacterized protein
MNDDAILAKTVAWLERAVIGLNLCPFAKGVHVKGQVHYRTSHATQPQEVLRVLEEELLALQVTDASERDTTLLILPDCCPDFLDFNDLTQDADGVLYTLGLEGALQIASFHPLFQFAGTDADDITNFTNRAPYAMLHLLREDSIARAVEAFPDAEQIYEKNMQTLEALGHAGWATLGLEVPDGAKCPKEKP